MRRGVLLLAQRDLLGRAKSLAADAFVDLLDLAAGFQECFDLSIDGITGFYSGSWLCFAADALTRMAAIDL